MSSENLLLPGLGICASCGILVGPVTYLAIMVNVGAAVRQQSYGDQYRPVVESWSKTPHGRDADPVPSRSSFDLPHHDKC
jgi:hypothetical protein